MQVAGFQLGVDFGTSHTVAVLRWPDGRAKPLLFDGSPLLPSAVYLDATGRLLVGRDALDSARLDPSRLEPNPKRRIDEGSLLLGDQALPVADVIAAVLGAVGAEAIRTAGGRPATVGRMGSPEHAEARIIEDDRTLPTGDQAKLRVVQAAQRMLDVSVADGPVVAKDVAFTTATAYQGIEPGSKTLRVQPAGGQATSIQVTITAGSIYSLLVLQGDDGKLSAAVLTDAKRAGQVPRGGVNTGAGGTANAGGSLATSQALAAALLLVVAGAGVAGAVLVGRRYVPAAVRARRHPAPRR